jgi:hypothetical protein
MPFVCGSRLTRIAGVLRRNLALSESVRSRPFQCAGPLRLSCSYNYQSRLIPDVLVERLSHGIVTIRSRFFRFDAVVSMAQLVACASSACALGPASASSAADEQPSAGRFDDLVWEGEEAVRPC